MGKDLLQTFKTDSAFESMPAANSTCKKLAVQWLNEALCFVSSALLADSFRLRNRQLLVAANRYKAHAKKPPHKWHIWFCPTKKQTLRKTKRANFCQRLTNNIKFGN